MWSYDFDKLSWSLRKDQLQIDSFLSLRQDLVKTRLFAKCFSGAVWSNSNSTRDIFSPIGYNPQTMSWGYSYQSGDYFSGSSDGLLDINSNFDYFSKWSEELGLGKRVWFSPNSSMNSLSSTYEVDFATDKPTSAIGSTINSLTIDSVVVPPGSKILVKDEKTFVTFSSTASFSPPGDFYYLSRDDGDTLEYYYYNSLNGIYEFTGESLLNITPSNYEDYKNLRVVVSSGSVNSGKVFSLKRKNDGTYPSPGDNNQWEQVESYLFKHKLEYNNLYEVGYNDVLWEDGYLMGTYSVPQRVIMCGDRGTILISTFGTSSYLKTKTSPSFKQISSTQTDWWIVGSEGTLIKINKISLEIKYISLDTMNTINGISFWGNLYACIVSSSGGIWITEDGGNNWLYIGIEGVEGLTDLKGVYGDNIFSFFIVGERGTFLKLIKVDNQWVVERIPLVRIDEQSRTEIVTENLNYITPHKTQNWSLTGERRTDKEFLVILSDRSEIFIYDKNRFSNFSNIILNVDFLNLSPRSSVFFQDNLVISGTNLISFNLSGLDFSTQSSNIIRVPQWQTITTESFNKIKNYQEDLWVVGRSSVVKKYTYPGFTFSFDYTKSYTDNLVPRFLILNYDLATKANFHDYTGEYRMPTPSTFSCFFTQGSTLEFKSPSGESTWMDYFKNSTLSFEYYSSFSQSNVVEFSTQFHFSTSPRSFHVVTQSGTSSYLYQVLENDPLSAVYEDLLPSTKNPLSSIWRGDISEFNFNVSTFFNVWITDRVILFKLNDYQFDESIFIKGQMLWIRNSYFSVNLPINKVVRGINNNQTPVFLWVIHNLPQDVIENFTENGFSVDNLNVFSSCQELSESFQLHPLSIGYKLSFTQSLFTLQGVYNNQTSYYNLSLDITHPQGTISLSYPQSFSYFGYTPNYSLESFLSRISPDIFTSSKSFSMLPKLENIPALDYNLLIQEALSPTYSSVLVDDINLSNKIVFSELFIEIFNSIFVNTFVDIVIQTSNYGDFRTNKCLVTKKYNISAINWWVVEFNKPINEKLVRDFLGASNIISVSILSRNTLGEISEDLKEINNINKSTNTKTIEYPFTFQIMENEISNKFSTHNYFLALISDGQLRSNVTSIIWEDESYKLSNLILDPLGDDLLKIQPVDISDVGVDRKQKNLIKISPNNIDIEQGKYSIVNIDYSQTRFQFTDGLTLDTLYEKYPWIVESEVERALVGEDSSGLIFYRGLWVCGRWFSGTWISGTWMEGDWYSGVWKSSNISLVDGRWVIDPLSLNNLSIWNNGRWFDGEWVGGTWRNGRKYMGLWKGGNWLGGIWNDGVWEGGIFSGGVWVDGTWKGGLFNSDSSYSYWLDGDFENGDFENGRWFDGKFSGQSFGKRSTNFKKSIWEAGTWLKGNFYSSIDILDGQTQDVSQDHKLSQFKSGNWVSGDFWGGTCFNINFNQGVFHGGIVDDIEVIGVRELSINDSTEILLNGTFRFSYPYDIWLASMFGSPLSVLGTIQNPKIHKIIFSQPSPDNTTTIVIPGIYPVSSPWKQTTDLRILSRFSGIRFLSGVWYNGIFLDGTFEGGMWHNGNFKGRFGI